MKFLLLLLSVTLLNKDCSPNVEQNNISIEYTASTRGTLLQVIIKDQNVSVIRQRGSNPKTKEFPKAILDKIVEELQDINIDNLENFNVPSKDHQFDGALIATLTIFKNNKAYQSKRFDHGNPPKEIVDLVKEILSISENIE